MPKLMKRQQADRTSSADDRPRGTPRPQVLKEGTYTGRVKSVVQIGPDEPIQVLLGQVGFKAVAMTTTTFKPRKITKAQRAARTERKYVALGQQHGTGTKGFKAQVARSADDVARDAAIVHLSKAMFTFRLTTAKFNAKMPNTRDGLITYVNQLQANIETLREQVGQARYQLTGSVGSA